MSDEKSPDYIVCADSDPVLVRVSGKANYLNCSPVNDFFEWALSSGKVRFVVDFEVCAGMDSTFLGVLAGVATKVMRTESSGHLILANLNEQNRQLIRGLGLHHLPTVRIQDDLNLNEEVAKCHQTISGMDATKEASAEMILQAHERLMQLNRANERRFQDVVRFLRREAEKGNLQE